MLKKHFLSSLLLAGVIGMAIYHRQDMMAGLQDIRIKWAIAGFFCLLLNYCLRAVRFYVLTHRRLDVWPQGIYCALMHGFATYMLPLRSGDFSLPFLLKSTVGINLQDGLAVLFKARLLEVFTLGLWFVAAATFSLSKLPRGIILSMAVCGIAMAAAPFVLKKVLSLSVIPFESLRKIANRLSRIDRMTLLEIVLTCGIWMAIVLGLWCVAFTIRLPLVLPDLFLLIALQLVMQLIPLQGFGNSGNHEGGWVAALVLKGFKPDEALHFALTSHAVVLVYVLIIGLFALLFRYLAFRSNYLNNDVTPYF